MSGYLPDYSMSVRAAQAYDEGEKPLSKWRKADILSAALKILSDSDLSEQEKKDRYSYLEKLPLNRLKGYLIQSSWHHTSCKYNETNFYYLDEEVLTDEDPKNFYDYEGNQEILDRLDKTTKDDRHYYALVSYEEVVLPKGVVLGDNVFPTDAKVVISENRIRNIPDLISGLSIFG